MLALDAAIFSAFSTNGTLTTAFPGGMRDDIAPEGLSNPYIIRTYIGAPVRTLYGNTKQAKVYVRFQAIGVGKATVGGLMATFVSAFDDTVLSLSSGQNYDCRRTTEPIPTKFPQRTVSAANVVQDAWMWTVEYVYETRN